MNFRLDTTHYTLGILIFGGLVSSVYANATIHVSLSDTGETESAT